MLFGDIKRAVASHTDVILFNIDSKADHRHGPGRHPAGLPQGPQRDAGLQRRPPAHRPHGALPRRQGQARRRSTTAYREATGTDWVEERDAYQFNRDEVVKALSRDARPEPGRRRRSGSTGPRSNFSLTVENFCKWVKEYLDSKGPQHRLIFLVDEVGQFIGTDSHLMLNLQTITEELGTICKGRAWVVVTSQEDIDAVLGEMKHDQEPTTSRRFRAASRPALSLSSANVDEVIQSRLLAKRPDVKAELRRRVQRRRATSSSTS